MRVLLAWSSGKDSAHALHVLRQGEGVEVVGLLTTLNAAAGRVAMHAVRHDLLQAQAAAVGLPLFAVPIPSPCPNEAYETAMAAALQLAVTGGSDYHGHDEGARAHLGSVSLPPEELARLQTLAR